MMKLTRLLLLFLQVRKPSYRREQAALPKLHLAIAMPRTYETRYSCESLLERVSRGFVVLDGSVVRISHRHESPLMKEAKFSNQFTKEQKYSDLTSESALFVIYYYSSVFPRPSRSGICYVFVARSPAFSFGPPRWEQSFSSLLESDNIDLISREMR